VGVGGGRQHGRQNTLRYSALRGLRGLIRKQDGAATNSA
jgi:hypothetical protein